MRFGKLAIKTGVECGIVHNTDSEITGLLIILSDVVDIIISNPLILSQAVDTQESVYPPDLSLVKREEFLGERIRGSTGISLVLHHGRRGRGRGIPRPDRSGQLLPE